ncbi:MAG: alpha-glucosidase [Clostridia bacterium]|nr:alpha-glucosidase [Clostridia bacterium]
MLHFSEQGDALHLLLDGREIYPFRVGDAPLRAGNGETDFSMTRGSFKIRDKSLSVQPLAIESFRLLEDGAELTLAKGRALLTVSRNRLKVDFDGLDGCNRLFVELPAAAEEHVYGTGETFSEFDLRGQKVNVWVAEHQNAKMIASKYLKIKLGLSIADRKRKFSEYETYYAQPTFLSSRKYYFHTHTTARCVFDFTDANRHTLRMDSVDSFCLGFGGSFAEVLADLTDLLGRQPELPDWVYDGFIAGIQGGTQTMLQKVDACLAHGTPINGVWIQDWEGRRITAFGKQLMWNWEWDRELYPDLDKAIADLRNKNIRVLGYCNPFLAIEKPLYKEAAERGYCVKDKNGKDYLVTITTFPAAMVDLTNPAAWDWLKDKIKTNMVDFGLSGWMADFGEYLPTDCVLFSGEDPKLVHNTWPARWAKLNREVIEEAGRLGDILFFTRAGFSETPRYSVMMWNGDNHVDFSVDNGLPSVIPAMLSLTCCGFGLSHSDTGGYTTFGKMRRSEELYMRWCEMNAFSLLLRSHEGNNPDLNAQFDASETVLKHQAKMARVHRLLKPYLQSAVRENAQSGMGVIRPLFFHYDEPQAYTESTEYLLGRDILVAPVIKKGAANRRVYLPQDEWIELTSGRTLGGGTVTADAPLGKIPVYYRKNADESLIKTMEEIKHEILS